MSFQVCFVPFVKSITHHGSIFVFDDRQTNHASLATMEQFKPVEVTIESVEASTPDERKAIGKFLFDFVLLMLYYFFLQSTVSFLQ